MVLNTCQRLEDRHLVGWFLCLPLYSRISRHSMPRSLLLLPLSAEKSRLQRLPAIGYSNSYLYLLLAIGYSTFFWIWEPVLLHSCFVTVVCCCSLVQSSLYSLLFLLITALATQILCNHMNLTVVCGGFLPALWRMLLEFNGNCCEHVDHVLQSDHLHSCLTVTVASCFRFVLFIFLCELFVLLF